MRGCLLLSLSHFSTFKVLLNRKETSMFAHNVKEALRGFPGGMIQKIEVTTNPSAKYDGEGIGGLLQMLLFAGMGGGLYLKWRWRYMDLCYPFSGKFSRSAIRS